MRSFLLSSANYFLERFHVDGLRVDAVASMLYLDYSRAEGEWIPNEHGGNENLEAVSFLRQLNETLYGLHPGIQIIAEESTAWPGVSRPVEDGGLGFGFKWDMGWMHDTLQFFGRDPVHRSHHGNELTFRSVYATSESFVLPLSHDEVVHGKGSLLDRMPGDDWQQLANLRLLLGYQWATPGHKLLFMGGELAHRGDWSHEAELDWGLLEDPARAGVHRWVQAANAAYREHPALHGGAEAFEWVVADDGDNSVFVFLRHGEAPVLVVANFTPLARPGYRVGVPLPGRWKPILESDDTSFGGSGVINQVLEAEPIPSHGRDHSVEFTAGPLAISFFVSDN